MIRVKGKKNLYRDEKTNAIVNFSEDDYKNYLKQRESKLEKQKKIESIVSDVETLKSDINEIKDLLKNIVNNFN